jgi:hypothetical protein
MATTTSITTTYAGEFAGKYIAAALLGGKTLSDGLITIKPNIKYKEVVKKVATDGIVKDATCDFTATSTITLTERIIQPEEFQVNLELCKKDFISDWEAISMGYSAFADLPKNFSDFLIAHVAAKVAAKTEGNIWNGANATTGEFDGFNVLVAADSDVVDVSGSPVTAANVVTELGKIVDAVPSAVYGADDLTIYAAPNIYKAYIRALGGFGSAGLGAAGIDNKGPLGYSTGQGLQFEGVNIVMAQGLVNEQAIAAEKSNLWFGTGLMSDQNEVKVIDMADLDGSQNVRIVMRFTAGIQYGIGSDIVWYA